MANLEQLERALRAADAAGNTEDARRLAQAYAQARGQQQTPSFGGVTSEVGSTASDPAPEPSLIEREGRGVGLSARSALQSVGSLVGAVGGDAFNAYVVDPVRKALHRPTMSGMITGQAEFQPSPSYREAAGMLADRAGLPQPANARERVLGDVGEALTGTAATMGAGGALAQVPGAVGRAGAFLSAQPALQTVSTATGAGAAGATREQGGGAGAQIAAGLAGALGPGVAGAGAGAAARGLVRGRSGEAMQQTIDDFRAVGATPSVGQASGNWAIQGGENLLAGGPTSAGVMNRFAERQADDIGAGLQRQAEGMMRNPSAERAGRAIERGTETFRGNVDAQKQALYWQADRMIPADSGATMQNTLRTLSDLTTPNPGAQVTTARMVNPRMRQMLDDLQTDLQANGGQIPYESLRRIRTSVGEQMNDFSMTQDTPAKQLSALYASLSRDMEAVAGGIGPDALRAARRANNYTRLSSNRLEQIQRVIDKNGGPEKIYQAATAGTRDGGTTLRAVMQSLPRDGQRAVTSAVIRRMGMATPGAQDAAGEVFSANTFLTNWNRVSPEAKRALFDRHGPQFTRNMDRIARVADNIKQGSRVYANPSGTANRGAAMTYGAALVGSMFTGGTSGLVGIGAAANLTARALTNPRVVQRLADATEMPYGAIPSLIHSMRTEGERTDNEALLKVAGVLEQRVQEPAEAAE